MSVGDARHGRRDNGLVAAEYAAAGDVDPRVGEHLLDVLALDGIAAYLRPSTDLHPVTRSTILPSRPTDRLFVDRAHVAKARDYVSRLAQDADQVDTEDPDNRTLAGQLDTGPLENGEAGKDSGHDDAGDLSAGDQETDDVERGERAGDGGADVRRSEKSMRPAHRMPEPTNDEVDRAWAEIIAGYDETAAPQTMPDDPERFVGGKPDTVRPDASRPETLRPETSRPDTRPRRDRPQRDRTDPDRTERDRLDRDRPELTPPYRIGPRMTSGPVDEPSLLDGLDTFGANLPDDGDEIFTPPVAPPVPRPSMPTMLAVIGVVGGLIVFLRPDLLSFINESLAMFLGFAAIVGGFGTLVWRLRPGDDDDDEDPDHGARV